jgi:CBS domain-containing protein
MKVRDLMHKGVEIMAPDTPVTKLAKKMRDKDIGAIPVGSNGQLVGMVTDRDITLRAVANGRDPSQLTAEDVMTKGVVCCSELDKVRDVLHIMEEKQIRRVPVIDENEQVVGMVSLGDISKAAPGKAREILHAVAAHHALKDAARRRRRLALRVQKLDTTPICGINLQLVPRRVRTGMFEARSLKMRAARANGSKE